MLSLLIVDDDARMRSLIRSIVEDLTGEITECGDGSEAQRCYAEQQPDWVLLDIVMPKMSGLEAARQIRAYDPSARIVMVTGHESEVLREAAASAGACAYVLKDNLFDLRQVLTLSA
jgi:two-component system, chemotaxis family, chemotaxis protein CheY